MTIPIDPLAIPSRPVLSVAPDEDRAVQPSLRPQAPSGLSDAPEAASAATDPTHVLVADDDELSRTAHVRVMTGWGYRCTCVSDGASALARLMTPGAPRLALVDWEMPGLNGIEVCRVLRSILNHPYVYIVMLTGLTRQQHLIDALTAGADDFLRKPVDLNELEVRLRAGRRIVQLQDQLLRAQTALEYRATHDGLTGIGNRAAILERLDRELAKRPPGRPLSVILMDVDHFKRVNDQLGHQSGDAVLREIAARGAHVLQADELLGRYGGEEFLVVLPDADESRGVDLAEQVRAVIAAAPVRTPDGQVPVTASFGVATAPSAQSGAHELIAAADRALYEAKARGRNQVVLAPSLALPTPASSESGDRAGPTLTSRSGAGSEADTTGRPRAIRAA